MSVVYIFLSLSIVCFFREINMVLFKEKPQAWSKEQVTDLELAEVAAFKEELSKKKEEGATKKEDTPTDGGNKNGKCKGKGKGKEPFEGEMKEVRKVGLSELWKYSTSFERLMVLYVFHYRKTNTKTKNKKGSRYLVKTVVNS